MTSLYSLARAVRNASSAVCTLLGFRADARPPARCPEESRRLPKDPADCSHEAAREGCLPQTYWPIKYRTINMSERAGRRPWHIQPLNVEQASAFFSLSVLKPDEIQSFEPGHDRQHLTLSKRARYSCE